MAALHAFPPSVMESIEEGGLLVDCFPLKDGKHVSFQGSVETPCADGKARRVDVFHLFWQERGGWTLWIDKERVTVGDLERLEGLRNEWSKEENDGKDLRF